MTQYLIAVWDYVAEGEFELSFKQGDRIKLLEKHNDDWYETKQKKERLFKFQGEINYIFFILKVGR